MKIKIDDLRISKESSKVNFSSTEQLPDILHQLFLRFMVWVARLFKLIRRRNQIKTALWANTHYRGNIMRNFLVVAKKHLILLPILAASLLVTSCGDNSGTNVDIAGVQGPHVNLFGDEILITAVLENIDIDGGLRYKIPEYNDSYVEIGPDLQSGGTLVSVSVSLDDIFNGGLEQLDPQTLPGGRALPGVASGSLPAVAFTIEKFKDMSFYLGPDVYAIFIPAALEFAGSIATFRYYINGKRMGNLSIVGQDENGENGGLFLALDLKASVKRSLKRIARRY